MRKRFVSLIVAAAMICALMPTAVASNIIGSLEDIIYVPIDDTYVAVIEHPFTIDLTCYDDYNDSTGEFNGEIDTLNYAMGGFSWDKYNYSNLADNEKTNFNKMYMKFDIDTSVDFPEDYAEIIITAPDGFSFSENELVNEFVTIEYFYSSMAQTKAIELYPIYSTSYADGDSVYFTVEVTMEYSAKTVYKAFDIKENTDEGNVMLQTGENYNVSATADMFADSSYSFNKELARLSLALSGSQYTSNDEITQAYKNLGFSNILIYNDADLTGVNCSLASKKVIIDGEIYTIIAVSCRGTVEGSEWIGNLALGVDSDYHDNFKLAETNVYNHLTDYRNYYGLNSWINDNVKLLINGHSRGAAAANLLAAEYDYGVTDPINAADIYTYTFACPNVVRSDDVSGSIYKNIFNIVFNNDIVPKVPLASEDIWAMGYLKYGILCVFPTEGTSAYAAHIDEVQALYKQYNNSDNEYAPLTAWDMRYIVTGIIAMSWCLPYYYNKIVCSHSIPNYISWLEVTNNSEYLSQTVTYKIALIKCPVNVEVYNSSGTLVGQVTNNAVDEITDGVYVTIEGDTKVVYLPDDDTYTLKITGYDDGTMNYTVQEYTAESGKTRVVNYMNVPVEKDKVTVGTINNELNTAVENYDLTLYDSTSVSADDDLSVEDIDNYDIQVNITGSGYVIGAGAYSLDERATLTAYGDGTVFDGWYIDDELVGSDETYSFYVTGSQIIEARFHTNEHVVNVSRSDDEIKINVSNCNDSDNTVIAAMYGESGELLNIRTQQPADESTCEITLDCNEAASYIKIMEWRNCNRMKPITEVTQIYMRDIAIDSE